MKTIDKFNTLSSWTKTLYIWGLSSTAYELYLDIVSTICSPYTDAYYEAQYIDELYQRYLQLL